MLVGVVAVVGLVRDDDELDAKLVGGHTQELGHASAEALGVVLLVVRRQSGERLVEHQDGLDRAVGDEVAQDDDAEQHGGHDGEAATERVGNVHLDGLVVDVADDGERHLRLVADDGERHLELDALLEHGLEAARDEALDRLLEFGLLLDSVALQHGLRLVSDLDGFRERRDASTGFGERGLEGSHRPGQLCFAAGERVDAGGDVSRGRHRSAPPRGLPATHRP